MAFSSGVYSLPSNSFAVPVTGTTISSTAAASTFADFVTAFSTCVLKDGTQTITADLPMAGFTLTGIAAANANGEPVRWQQASAGVMTTTGDMLYASAANTPARLGIGTARQQLATNSGATAPEWVASLQSLMTGTGDIVQSSGANTPARLAIGSVGQALQVNAGATAAEWASITTLGTPVATTSGTSFSFTGIPAGVKRVTISLVGVSLSGSDALQIQIGPVAGVETSGYLGSVGSGATFGNFTAAFGLTTSGGAASVHHGTVILTLENSSTNIWTCSGTLGLSNAATAYLFAYSKPLAGALSVVKLMTNGTDTFDAGEVNIAYSS